MNGLLQSFRVIEGTRKMYSCKNASLFLFPSTPLQLWSEKSSLCKQITFPLHFPLSFLPLSALVALRPDSWNQRSVTHLPFLLCTPPVPPPPPSSVLLSTWKASNKTKAGVWLRLPWAWESRWRGNRSPWHGSHLRNTAKRQRGDFESALIGRNTTNDAFTAHRPPLPPSFTVSEEFWALLRLTALPVTFRL